MKIALIHPEYRLDHLELVEAEMRELGPPNLRAIWRPERGAWAILEGCHRTRAAKRLGLLPEIVPVEYVRGRTTWDSVGMGDYGRKVALTIDELVADADAGVNPLIEFGAGASPMFVPRRPQKGEVMKYRIIKPINFDFGNGVVGGLGRILTNEEVGCDLSNWVTGGFLEIVEDAPAPKVTKEVRHAPMRKGGRS